jgi:hypothetical protein
VAESPRDEFPNNFVGDLVRTDRGWVVVPPTSCPAGHDYGDGDWSVSAVWCTCNGRHMAWRCHCGAVLYALSRNRGVRRTRLQPVKLIAHAMGVGDGLVWWKWDSSEAGEELLVTGVGLGDSR